MFSIEEVDNMLKENSSYEQKKIRFAKSSTYRDMLKSSNNYHSLGLEPSDINLTIMGRPIGHCEIANPRKIYEMPKSSG